MMGSGKSRTGAELAARLDMPRIDTDEEIVSRLGCSIAQFWGEQGEAAFRSMERATITRVASGPAAVIATGGGAVLSDNSVATMRRSGRVVWLTAPVATLAARVGSGTERPLLIKDQAAANLAAILEARTPLYVAAADIEIDTASGDVPETVDRIEAWWNESS